MSVASGSTTHVNGIWQYYTCQWGLAALHMSMGSGSTTHVNGVWQQYTCQWGLAVLQTSVGSGSNTHVNSWVWQHYTCQWGLAALHMSIVGGSSTYVNGIWQHVKRLQCSGRCGKHRLTPLTYIYTTEVCDIYTLPAVSGRHVAGSRGHTERPTQCRQGSGSTHTHWQSSTVRNGGHDIWQCLRAWHSCQDWSQLDRTTLRKL